MAQYCRYCSELICGDSNYCRAKDIIMTDAEAKRTNKCKQFDLLPIDALGENEEGYKPKPKRTNEMIERQIKIE